MNVVPKNIKRLPWMISVCHEKHKEYTCIRERVRNSMIVSHTRHSFVRSFVVYVLPDPSKCFSRCVIAFLCKRFKSETTKYVHRGNTMLGVMTTSSHAARQWFSAREHVCTCRRFIKIKIQWPETIVPNATIFSLATSYAVLQFFAFLVFRLFVSAASVTVKLEFEIIPSCLYILHFLIEHLFLHYSSGISMLITIICFISNEYR